MFSSLYVKALEYPRWFLAVTTLIVFALITRGDFSDFDTVGRLQVTHWLWTSEPQVSEGYRYSIPTPPTAINIFSAPGFCALIGKDGQIFAQFGLGQSVIMLPADIFSYFIVKRLSENRNYHSTDSRIADFIVKRLGENRKYRSTDNRIAEDFKFGEIPAEHGFMRNTIVNLTTFPVISAVAIVLAYDLVTILGFTPAISLSASLLLLTSTTFIVYMQDVEENTLMFMCYAGALVFALKTKLRSPRLNAFVSGVFVGFNLLIQLPNIVYLPSILVLLVWISTRKSSQAGGDNARQVIGNRSHPPPDGARGCR